MLTRVPQLLLEYCEQLLDDHSNRSPLEESILQEVAPVSKSDVDVLEEKVAIAQIVATSQDWCVEPNSLPTALGFLVAQILPLSNEKRSDLITLQNADQRLRHVLTLLDEQTALNHARKVANSITHTDPKELQVGDPKLPPWTLQLRPGMRIEYYWNDEYEWCRGTVAEETIRIDQEIVVTVEFDDGEVHRLPCNPEEKLRWRPASGDFE